MPDTSEELQTRLALLRQEKTKNEEFLIRVNDLLSKADKRRCTEVGNRRKWDSVLENLERSLDTLKAKREVTHVEFKQVQRKLDVLEKDGGAESRGKAPTENQQQDTHICGFVNSDSSRAAAKQILSMSLDELAKLSLEEVSRLHQRIGVDFSDELLVDNDNPEVAAQMELANQVNSQTQSYDAPSPVRRRQQLLRAAIEKILSNNIKALTEEEVQITLICHALLRRRVNPSIRDERLIRVLGGFVKMVHKDHAPGKT